MNHHEKFRFAVKRLEDAKACERTATLQLETAEREVVEAKEALSRTLRSVFGDSPVFYRSHKYEAVGIGISITALDVAVVSDEESAP